MNICLIFNERPVLNWLRPVWTSNQSRPVLIGFLRSFDRSSPVFWGIGALVDRSRSRSKPLGVKYRDQTRLSITISRWFFTFSWVYATLVTSFLGLCTLVLPFGLPHNTLHLLGTTYLFLPCSQIPEQVFKFHCCGCLLLVYCSLVRTWTLWMFNVRRWLLSLNYLFVNTS